ncbi:MAG TPA: hypothetical protein VGL38_03425 [bacterium]|jgi:hypothetical protein
MSNEWSSILIPLIVVVGILALLAWIGIRVRKGGGSMTTVAMGATDEFLSRDQSRAVEVIVERNAGNEEESQSDAAPEKPRN